MSLVGASREQVTDANGTFALTGVPAGSAAVSVSLVGYGLSRREVTVRPNEETRVEVPLADGTSTYTDSVTVVSDRFSVPSPASPRSRR